MLKKAVLAVCSMALLAVAFVLPASAQDTRSFGNAAGSSALMARGTFTKMTPEVKEPITPAPPAIIYDNYAQDMFGAKEICTGCPQPHVSGTVHSFVFQQWQPEGWLIVGPSDPFFPGVLGQSIANPFVPTAKACPVTCHINKIELPVQQTARTGTTEEYQIAFFPDDGLDEPAFGNFFQLAAWAHADADPVFPVCCLKGVNDTIINISPSIQVSPGLQYWMVVDANTIFTIDGDPNDQDNAAIATEAVWAFNLSSNYGRISPTYVGNFGLTGTWATYFNFQSGGNLFPTNPGGSTAPAMKLTGTSP